MKVGIKDIAKHAGVSAVTVSAALSGTGRVGEKKRREIMRIAERLKYQPNTLAQMLKSKRKDAIGLIINSNPDSIPGAGVMTKLIVEFIKFCEINRKKYHIEFNDPDNGQDKVPDIISSGFVGGVVFAGFIYEHQTRLRHWLESNPDFPFVAFEEPSDYCVRTDYVKGMLNSIKYLKEQGHVNIALHIGPLRFDVHNLVHRGFQAGIASLAMNSRKSWIYQDMELPDDRKEKFAWLQSILNDKDAPTVVVCCGMGAARNIINFSYQLGLKIPDDLSILGIGYDWAATAVYPHITSLERDISKMLEDALAMLHQRSKCGIEATENWIEPKLIHRETVKKLNLDNNQEKEE